MPLPLTLGMLALRAARRMHTASAAERPMLLRRVYFARVAVYGVCSAGALLNMMAEWPCNDGDALFMRPL